MRLASRRRHGDGDARPGTAHAVDYPPASDPGKLPPEPKGKKVTLHVCKDKKKCFRTIQKAVNAARGGDTIKVANGTYKEAVLVEQGPQGPEDHRQLGHPEKVVLDGRARGAKANNGFLVNGVDDVTINGMKARTTRPTGSSWSTRPATR